MKLLEPALKSVPRVRVPGNDTLPRALNLLGLAYKKLGRTDDASNLYEAQGELPRALAMARNLAARGRRLSSQGWFLARKLIVRVALALGDVSLATRTCHDVRGELEHEEPSATRRGSPTSRRSRRKGARRRPRRRPCSRGSRLIRRSRRKRPLRCGAGGTA